MKAVRTVGIGMDRYVGPPHLRGKGFFKTWGNDGWCYPDLPPDWIGFLGQRVSRCVQ